MLNLKGMENTYNQRYLAKHIQSVSISRLASFLLMPTWLSFYSDLPQFIQPVNKYMDICF
jgi:hypothetical protein